MITRIRYAVEEDIDRLMEIFDIARQFMRQNGNANQWVNGYPQRSLIDDEIKKLHCLVCENEKSKVVACFSFIAGPDETYAYIEDGQWLSDTPYYVIHRLASDQSCGGVTQACLEWCTSQHKCLRVDTHQDNKVMQHILETHGFVRCGIIYIADGSSRIAYQWGK